MKFNQFPRINLDVWPTPIHRIARYGSLIGHEQLYIKRDDMSILGLGGNKIRKLEFWLGDALAKNCDVIVVAGGEQSNLVRLTAAACAKQGLDCIAVHNSDKPNFYQGNALLNYYFGAESVFLGPINEDERGIEVNNLVKLLKKQGRRPYVVNNEFVGTLGYTQCVAELNRQNNEQGIGLKHIVIVGAMGFTAAGFIYGNSLLKNPFKVHVISVEYPKSKLDQIVKTNVEQLIKLTGIESLHLYESFTCTYEDWMGEGWGVPTKTSLKAVKDIAQTEAIIIDHVYNAKTFDGLKGLVEQGIIPKDEPTCIIHTGGAPAFFGYAELFQPKND